MPVPGRFQKSYNRIFRYDMKRNSFLLYVDSMDILTELTDVQAGKLFKAVYLYQKHITDPDNMEYEECLADSLIRIAFTPIRLQLDRDYAKYKDVCAKRASAGRKGGLSKARASASSSETEVPAISPVRSFSAMIEELNSDQLWIEQMCRQSGINAAVFLSMAKEQIVKFFDYITATGQESTVLTTNDAKRRFFWWWKNQGIKEYKSNQNDGSNNGRTFKCKTDIKPRSEAEKDYSGKIEIRSDRL